MDFSLYTSFPRDLKTEWNELLAESVAHVPFLRHEYLETWWASRGGGEWDAETQLCIVTGREHGRLVGIAPLFHAMHESRSSLLLVGSVEISDYLDLVVRPTKLEAFLTGLLPYLAGPTLPSWDTLDLYNILESSATLPALERASTNLGWSFSSEKLKHCPYIPLPGNFETYLAGIDKKQRHEIRRKVRRLEESGVPQRWYFLEDASALDLAIRDFLALMALDPAKAAFLTSSMRIMMEGVMRCAFENGCLKLAFLEIDARRVAAYLNFDYLGRVWVYNSGLDWTYNEFSPGWVLLAHLLQWANENKRTEFDFMRGDEEYKYRFGARDRFVMRAKLSRN
jgi:CelD/BcsL family acetyltransferase involved in cellulose biosynthesis